MADGAEHPPQAGGDRARYVVVHDYLVIAANTQATQARGELGDVGEGVATGAATSRQIVIEIDEDGPGDVACHVVGDAPPRIGQGPPDVEEPDLVEPTGQLLGVYQRGQSRQAYSSSEPASSPNSALRSFIVVSIADANELAACLSLSLTSGSFKAAVTEDATRPQAPESVSKASLTSSSDGPLSSAAFRYVSLSRCRSSPNSPETRSQGSAPDSALGSVSCVSTC